MNNSPQLPANAYLNAALSGSSSSAGTLPPAVVYTAVEHPAYGIRGLQTPASSFTSGHNHKVLASSGLFAVLIAVAMFALLRIFLSGTLRLNRPAAAIAPPAEAVHEDGASVVAPTK